jgi:hypothetical protein
MSEQTAMQVPAHIAARIAQRQGAKSAALDAVLSGISYPKISIRASRFRLVDEGVETVIGTELDVVFVAVNPRVSKTWYDKPYSADSDDKTPPACWSHDGIKPDPQVANPVNDNCAQCPKNVLGSRMTPSNKPSKECGDIRFVAVMPSADPSKVYGLTVPVSAMKDFRKYFKELSQYGLVPEEVITTLGFDDEASFPKLTFKHKGYVPEKYLNKIVEMGTTTETKQIIRVATGPLLSAPKPTSAPSKPVEVATPPPVQERVVAEAPTDEPVDVAPPPPPPPAKPKAAAKPAAAPKAAEAPAASDKAVDALEKQLDDLFGAG